MFAQLDEVAGPDVRALARMLGDNGYFRRSSSSYSAEPSHKEWLHFAVHSEHVDLLANFSVVDDVRKGGRGAEIPRITCLIKERHWDGDIDQYSPADVQISSGHLAVRFGESCVALEGDELRLKVRMQRRPIEIDLRLVPLAMPTPAFNLHVEHCPPINWLVVPRLLARGTVRIDGRTHELRDAPAYHDHNWGHFRWGKNFAWEWGYGTPEQASNPWTMVFVRLSDRGHVTDLMQALFLWKGSRQARLFRGSELEVWHEGLLRPRQLFKLPRVMGLVSPGTACDVPQTLHARARGNGDQVELRFDCEEVAQVLIPNDEDLGVTIINEVSGRLAVEGIVGGEKFALSGPSIFEFLSD